jgi:hypothetical protein
MDARSEPEPEHGPDGAAPPEVVDSFSREDLTGPRFVGDDNLRQLPDGGI